MSEEPWLRASPGEPFSAQAVCSEPGCLSLPGPSDEIGPLGRAASLDVRPLTPRHLIYLSLPPHRCFRCQWPMGKAGPPPWLAPSLEAQVGSRCLGTSSLHKKMSLCRGWAGAEQEQGTAPDLECGVGLRLAAASCSGCQRRSCWGGGGWHSGPATGVGAGEQAAIAASQPVLSKAKGAWRSAYHPLSSTWNLGPWTGDGKPLCHSQGGPV